MIASPKTVFRDSLVHHLPPFLLPFSIHFGEIPKFWLVKPFNLVKDTTSPFFMALWPPYPPF
jgi:hypothetical protein